MSQERRATQIDEDTIIQWLTDSDSEDDKEGEAEEKGAGYAQKGSHVQIVTESSRTCAKRG